MWNIYQEGKTVRMYISRNPVNEEDNLMKANVEVPTRKNFRLYALHDHRNKIARAGTAFTGELKLETKLYSNGAEITKLWRQAHKDNAHVFVTPFSWKH